MADLLHTEMNELRSLVVAFVREVSEREVDDDHCALFATIVNRAGRLREWAGDNPPRDLAEVLAVVDLAATDYLR